MTIELDPRERAWRQWRDDVRRIGGPDTLLQFDPDGGGAIELTSGHPGGLAQLLSGHATRLSNLIREERAFMRAQRSMVEIDQNAAELAEERGIDSVSLAVGLAVWDEDGRTLRAPILLQPILLRQVTGDFELRFSGSAIANPALEVALAERFGVDFPSGHFSGVTVDPHRVIERLSALTKHIGGIKVVNRMFVGTFSDDVFTTLRRMDTVAHPLLDALARVPGAREELSAHPLVAPSADADERALEQDTLLLDCDAEQEKIINQIASGTDVLVQTIPGGGTTRLVVNALGRLVMAGKRVAVVSGGREALRRVATCLHEVGLDGVAVSPASLNSDVIAGIVRNEKAKPVDDAPHREALQRIRNALVRYRGALGAPHRQFGVSMLQVVNELARLSLLPSPPVTTARLGGDALRHVASHRAEVVEKLEDLAHLGEFAHGPEDSPWYGATFRDPGEAKSSYVIARRLSESDLPELMRRAEAVFAAAEVRPARTLAEVGEHVAMLLGIRDSLDRFLPDVFDRPLDDLILATDPSKPDSMTSANRRRLRHLAREYVRPGMHVSDMHIALIGVNEQRERWMRVVGRPKPPTIPPGIGDLHVQYSSLASDVGELASVIDQSRVGRLVDLPLDQLLELFSRLAADEGALANLRERTEIRRSLRDVGLDGLAEDFATQRVPAARVRIELEQAWWQSVYEYLVADDPGLFHADATLVARLENDFIRLDAEHIGKNPARLAGTLAQRWRQGLQQYPGEAEILRGALRQRTLDSQTVLEKIPGLSRTVAPVWLLSPYSFAAVTPEGVGFDAVIVLDGESVGVAETVLPMASSPQTVVFGDPVLAEPRPFRVAAKEQPGDSGETPVETPQSLFGALVGLVPRLVMRRSYRAGGRALAALVNKRYYDDRIEALPTASEAAGISPVRWVHVERGSGLPDPVSHVVEAVPAEVQKVVELVFSHATWHPSESLMVVTASPLHARRVRAAVREELRQSPQLSAFFRADRDEPFVVLTAAQAAGRSRDHVIFSLGYGKTAHGRVLADFGAFSKPGGQMLLATALTCARRGLIVVSCFTSGDLEPERFTYGARAFAELAQEAEEAARSDLEEPEVPAEHAGPLIVDLANRLRARGAVTTLEYGGEFDLVVRSGDRGVVIESDAAYGNGTLREMIRLRPELIEASGWRFERVFTFDLFSDPQKVADSIASILGLAVNHDSRDGQGPAVETSRNGRQRRATLPAKNGVDIGDEQPFDERPEAWGDKKDDEDTWLLSQRPPHWG